MAYFLPFIYRIYFQTRFGQTIGKMATQIKLYDISLKPVSFQKVVVRESIYFGMGIPLFFVAFNLIGITDSQFLLPLLERRKLLYSAISYPGWVNWTMWTWLFIEILVFLTNKKKRALHDYLAGTVVVCLPVNTVGSDSSAT